MCLMRKRKQFASTSQPKVHLHKFLNEHSPVRNTSVKLVLSPHVASKRPCWFGSAFLREKVNSFAAS